MKPITNRLANIAGPLLFPLYFIWRKAKKKTILFLLITIVLTSCFQHYFRTNTQKSVDAATIQKLLTEGKYFVVHFNNSVMAMQNIIIADDKLNADLIDLPKERLKYTEPNPDKANLVKVKAQSRTLMEVHLYSSSSRDNQQTHLSLPLSALNRIDIYEFDAKATSRNRVLSIVGIVAGVTAIAMFVSFMVACNCPQVFVNNNGQYEFVSGVYSGAIYSSLERTDYLPLPSSVVTGNTYQLKIFNVKNEEQFINREQLLQVSHPAGTSVLADRHGNIFSYDKPEAPVSAIINEQVDIKKQLSSTDNDSYLFDGEKGDKGFSNVVLTFNKPVGVKKAKLIVHAGNSVWSGYIYHSFNALFGNGYDKWKEAKDKSNPKEMEQWQMDQKLPLMVYVEENGHWGPVDYFAHTGNTASRDMIMELDVSKIQSEYIKIKLETVYQFWDLDFAGIDFSENKTIVSSLINASSAVKTNGENEKESLSQCDKQYCHLGTDEGIMLQYPITASSGNNVNSYFLVSSGYYHNQLKNDNKPQTEELLRFRDDGAFDRFSRNKFSEIMNSLNKYTVNNK